jgi:hypothetical protein
MRAVEYLKILIRVVYLSTLRCVLRFSINARPMREERKDGRYAAFSGVA